MKGDDQAGRQDVDEITGRAQAPIRSCLLDRHLIGVSVEQTDQIQDKPSKSCQSHIGSFPAKHLIPVSTSQKLDERTYLYQPRFGCEVGAAAESNAGNCTRGCMGVIGTTAGPL